MGQQPPEQPPMQPLPQAPMQSPGQPSIPPSQPVPPQVPKSAGPPMAPSGRPLAEWWKRLVAAIIDNAIIGIPLWILYFVIIVAAATTATPAGELRSPGAFGGALVLWFLLAFTVPLGYYTLFHGSSGQTLGKKAMKIQVVDESGSGVIGYGRAFLRWLIGTLLGALTCGIGGLLNGLWPLWDERRQAIHDKPAKSLVIDIG